MSRKQALTMPRGLRSVGRQPQGRKAPRTPTALATLRRLAGLVACCAVLLVCAAGASTAQARAHSHAATPAKTHQKAKSRRHKPAGKPATSKKKHKTRPHSKRGPHAAQGETAAEEAEESEESEEESAAEEFSEESEEA